MLSPLTTLSDYIKTLGKAYVYWGDPTTADGMVILGATEGDITVDETFKYNDLTAPEWTGDAVHARMLDGQNISITVPLIWGNDALYDTISPVAAKGGGRSRPTAVTTQTLLVIAQSEVPDAGLSLAGGPPAVWTPAAPKNAIWLWKACPMPSKFAFKHGDGGKVIREVTFTPLFDDSKPEGQKLYTIGDPTAQGITGLTL